MLEIDLNQRTFNSCSYSQQDTIWILTQMILLDSSHGWKSKPIHVSLYWGLLKTDISLPYGQETFDACLLHLLEPLHCAIWGKVGFLAGDARYLLLFFINSTPCIEFNDLATKYKVPINRWPGLKVWNRNSPLLELPCAYIPAYLGHWVNALNAWLQDPATSLDLYDTLQPIRNGPPTYYSRNWSHAGSWIHYVLDHKSSITNKPSFTLN